MTSSNINNDEVRKSYEKVGLIYNTVRDHVDEKIFIERLLQKEGNINYRITDGSKSVPNLLLAARCSNNEIFNLLLDNGADFTYKNEEGKTIVHMVITDRVDSKNLHLVLHAHVKFKNFSNPSDENGITHFHVACIRNHSSAIEFFLNNGVDVNHAVNLSSPNFPLYTPLHLAVKHICLDAVEILLKYGADIHLKNAAGLSPLHLIFEKIKQESVRVASKNKEKYRRLLIVFAKFAINDDTTTINTVDDYGFCKFHLACILYDQTLIESMLKQMTNINQAVNFDSLICPGYTPLHFAAFSKIEIFKLLLDNGADIEAKNAMRLTPLDLCAQNSTIDDILSILSMKQEWRSIVLSDNRTMLIDVVSAMENVDEFNSLLNGIKSSTDIFVPFDSPVWPGYTLLHLAVIFISGKWTTNRYQDCRRNYDVTKIDACLKRGADMTIKDAKGLTALHLAFYSQKKYIVEYLLDHHVSNENPIDENNLSHFHIACIVNHQKAVEHFLSINVDVNIPVYSTFEQSADYQIHPGFTALHISVASGDSKITKILLKHGADVNVQDNNGFTPIHRIVFNPIDKARDISKLLFSVENLRNITTSCGLSHLHVACRYGNCNAIKKLLKLGADINCKCNINVNEYKKYYDPYDLHKKSLTFLSEHDGHTRWCTPLHLAFIGRANSAALILTSKYSDAFAKNNDKPNFPLQLLLLWLNDRDVYLRMIKKNIVLKKYLEEKYGITELHIACHIADVNLIENVIKRGANVNARVNVNSPKWQGYTPLCFVVKLACKVSKADKMLNRLKKIVRVLLKHGAHPLLTDDYFGTPFHLIKSLHYQSSKYLDIPSIARVIFTILFNSVKNFNVNPTDNQGLSVFHVACMTLNVTIIEKFLKHNVDFHQNIGYFSQVYPGSTPLHILIRQYGQKINYPLDFNISDDVFFKVIDMLLETGANVNATDAHGNTPLHEAIQLIDVSSILIEKGAYYDRTEAFDNTPLHEAIVQLIDLRSTLIKKLISKDANPHITNVKGITPFELLLRRRDATSEEIDIFLQANCFFNSYNPITRVGCMATFLLYYKGIELDDIMENQFVLRIIDDPKIIDIDNWGRTAIHNVVSIKPEIWYPCNALRTPNRPWFVHLFRAIFRIRNVYVSYADGPDFNYNYYGSLIERLIIRGCDIDHQDNEGKTALHLAVEFQNDEAFLVLLRNGADINITDKSGKTPFAYRDSDESFAKHVYKLEFCKQYVNDQNKQLQIKVMEKFDAKDREILNKFHDEMDKTKRIKIGNTSICLYEFLTTKDMSIIYANMTNEERREVDEFFQNIELRKIFYEINCLVKLKYKKTIERTKLLEPAMKSLDVLIKCQLPHLCCRNIISFLKNEDLKRLITALS